MSGKCGVISNSVSPALLTFSDERYYILTRLSPKINQQKRTQLPIFNIDFAKENKTQRQQTKYSVAGIFCSYLDLNTAGEKPSSSKSSFDARGSPSKGRYTSLSDII